MEPSIKYVFCLSQHVTVEDSYLCGYLKINGLTEVSLQATSWVVRLIFILLKSIHWLVSARFKQAAMWQSTLDQWFTTFPLQKQKIVKNVINQLMSKRRAKFNWLHQPTFFFFKLSLEQSHSFNLSKVDLARCEAFRANHTCLSSSVSCIPITLCNIWKQKGRGDLGLKFSFGRASERWEVRSWVKELY